MVIRRLALSHDVLQSLSSLTPNPEEIGKYSQAEQTAGGGRAETERGRAETERGREGEQRQTERGRERRGNPIEL